MIDKLYASNKILKTWRNVRENIGKSILLLYPDDISDKNKNMLELIANYKNTKFGKYKLVMEKEMYSNYFMVDLLFVLAVILGWF